MRDESINVWQTSIMLFLLMFANKILILPSLFFNDANVEGILCFIILFVLEIALITLFIFLKRKYPTISFVQLIKEKFGKITTIIIYFLILTYFLCKLVLIYNVTYMFFKDLIYSENSSVLFLICLLPIINYLAFLNLRAFGRTCQLFFPVILIFALFCVVVSFIGTNSVPLFYQSSFSDVILTSLKHISSFGDAVFLFVLMDKIEYKKGDGKKVFFFFSLASIMVVLVAVSFYFAYTYTSFMHPYAIFEILGNIKDYGGLGRIDVIAVIFVMFITYFQMAIYLKCFSVCFEVLLPKLKRAYSLVVFDFLFIIIVELILRNLEKTITYGENVLPYFSIVSFVIVPLCTIFFLIIKSNKERKWWTIFQNLLKTL